MENDSSESHPGEGVFKFGRKEIAPPCCVWPLFPAVQHSQQRVMAKHVTTEAQWKAEKGIAGKLVVVDFFAQWCGPCKKIAPYVEELSKEFAGVSFLKVDVDELPDVATDEGISSMPTFRFYRDGQKIGEVVGASHQKLKELVQKHQ